MCEHDRGLLYVEIPALVNLGRQSGVVDQESEDEESGPATSQGRLSVIICLKEKVQIPALPTHLFSMFVGKHLTMLAA